MVRMETNSPGCIASLWPWDNDQGYAAGDDCDDHHPNPKIIMVIQINMTIMVMIVHNSKFHNSKFHNSKLIFHVLLW